MSEGVKFYRMQRRDDPYTFVDYDPRLWCMIVVPADQPAAVPEWDESKCTCVYATAQNTESVRKGYEMGGYVKEVCDYCTGSAADKPGEVLP